MAGGVDRAFDAAPAGVPPARDRALAAGDRRAAENDRSRAHQQDAAAVAQAGPVPARIVPSLATVMALTRPKAFSPGDSACTTTLCPRAARPSRTEAGMRAS